MWKIGRCTNGRWTEGRRERGPVAESRWWKRTTPGTSRPQRTSTRMLSFGFFTSGTIKVKIFSNNSHNKTDIRLIRRSHHAPATPKHFNTWELFASRKVAALKIKGLVPELFHNPRKAALDFHFLSCTIVFSCCRQ